MPPRRATISQADMNRVLRAARQNGAKLVEMVIGGEVVRVVLCDENSVGKVKATLAKKPKSII